MRALEQVGRVVVLQMPGVLAERWKIEAADLRMRIEIERPFRAGFARPSSSGCAVRSNCT